MMKKLLIVFVIVAWVLSPAALGDSTEKADTSSELGKIPETNNAKLKSLGSSLFSAIKLREAAGVSRLSAQLRDSLASLGEDDLAVGLFLLGKSQKACYELSEQKDKKTLARAGLSYMRVYVYFPRQKSLAAEALYEVGQIHEMLGNTTSAKSAYAMLCRRFSKSAFFAKAKQALEKLK